MKAESEEYYRRAIEWWKKPSKDVKAATDSDNSAPKTGKITVNGKNVECDYEIADGDKIIHEVIR